MIRDTYDADVGQTRSLQRLGSNQPLLLRKLAGRQLKRPRRASLGVILGHKEGDGQQGIGQGPLKENQSQESHGP